MGVTRFLQDQGLQGRSARLRPGYPDPRRS